ncbi:MAG: ligand-binding protein SH3, partial [SAR324 cluster bacterium]|nr:ligand-binding protein SH3 [SAR324 cluster bacterium]
ELKGIFSGWDLAFYYAEFFDDSAHAELVVRDGVPQPRLRHSRLTMRGAAVNVALGNWLLKSEAALFDGLEFFSAQGEPFKPKERWDAMVGLDYNGINDTTITVEAVNRRIHDFEPNLDETGEELNQYALSYRGDFLNQTLTLNGILLLFGNAADEGGVQRYSVEYDVFDAFSVTGGVLIFQSAGDGNPLFQRVRLNDRVFFDIKYSF